jgi:hypothetical protein
MSAYVRAAPLMGFDIFAMSTACSKAAVAKTLNTVSIGNFAYFAIRR